MYTHFDDEIEGKKEKSFGWMLLVIAGIFILAVVAASYLPTPGIYN